MSAITTYCSKALSRFALQWRMRTLTAFVVAATASAIPHATVAQPAPLPLTFSFAVIGSALGTHSDDGFLKAAIGETDADNLAFVVVNGIKPRNAPCSDQVFEKRRRQLQQAQNGIIVSLVASDWTKCKTPSGRYNAIERLNRLRDFFFNGDFSLGSTRIPLMRQSASPQFRDIGENARWEIGDVLFATINLPGDNNRYLTDAGRNSEYEDRLISNRAWLKRLMTIATYRGFRAVVLFAEGDPMPPLRSRTLVRETAHDGFADVRRQLKENAARFDGKVLLIHGQPSEVKSWTKGGIRWKGNLGVLDASTGLLRITADPESRELFAVERELLVVSETAQVE